LNSADFGNWEWFSQYPFEDFPKIADDTYCVVFFGMMNVGEAQSDSACHLSTPNSHSLWIPFLRSPHAFWVLGTISHDMIVLSLSVVARPDYNPSHSVFRQAAPQILVGASATCSFLLH
jgi:hypothetical protein